MKYKGNDPETGVNDRIQKGYPHLTDDGILLVRHGFNGLMLGCYVFFLHIGLKLNGKTFALCCETV